MKKHYPWLWFDADGTLFDYAQAEGNALQRTFQALSLPFDERVLDTYRRINSELWQALERQEITAPVLQVRRFELLLETLQSAGSAPQLSRAYLEHLALGTELMEGAYEVVHTLAATCQIAIITNGLKAVQRSRLSRSPIREFVRALIISEEVGAAKPHAAFFDAAMSRTGNPPRREVLVIGDSLTSDMRGGVDYGLDTCWFNPGRTSRPEDLPVTYEIGRLGELLEWVN